MNSIVSKMAMPAVTEPPGELMYSAISAVGSSAASKSICAAIRLAMSSSTCWPSTMMRCWSSRSYTESDNVIVVGEPPRRMAAPLRRSWVVTSPCPLTGVCSVLPELDLYGSTLRGGRSPPAGSAALFAVGVRSGVDSRLVGLLRRLVGVFVVVAEQLRHVQRGAGRVGDRGGADGGDERLAAPHVGVDGA